MIKRRNPLLWYKIVQNRGDKFEIGLVNIEDATLIIPEFINPLFTKTILYYLNPSYRYFLINGNNKVDITIEQLKQLKTISEGLSKINFTRFYLPRYQICVILLAFYKDLESVKIKIEFEALYSITKSFEFLILSFNCFQIELTGNRSTIHSSLLNMIFNSVKQLISGDLKLESAIKAFKSNQSAQLFTTIQKLQTYQHCVDYDIYYSVQFSVFANTINVRLELCNHSDLKQEEFTRILDDIGEFLFIIESICHVTAEYIIKWENIDCNRPKLPAYLMLYQRRRLTISHRYLDQLRLDVSEQKYVKNSKPVILALIKTLDLINWPQVQAINRDLDCALFGFDCLATKRLFIQSTLLIVGDLDLVSRLRTVKSFI